MASSKAAPASGAAASSKTASSAKRAAERLSAEPGECAYVGDSPFDIRAAKTAGMHAVAVTWGGIHDRAKLEAERPDAIVDTAEQLYGVL